MAKETKQIVGLEISEGVSKKTGKPYSIGTLYTVTKLAPPLGGEDNIAKGYMGDKYSCDANILRKIAHLPFPVQAEVETESVMRFGERQKNVVDLRPLAANTKAA